MTATLRPRDESDLAEILATHPRPLEPVGGGTKRAIGRPVAADALELAALAGIVAYEPAELVLTARAATPLAQIEALLGQHRQRLAFEPPDPQPLLGDSGTPTIGGVLASNSSGPRRLSAGAARDHFLGFHAVSGRGERFRGGGRVVKNVTGYDLPKLIAGSWGTLAVLTEVTVRVLPAAEHDCTLLFEALEPEAAVSVFARALGSSCEVTAAALEPQHGLALRLEGIPESVRVRAARLIELLGVPLRAELAGEDSRSWWVRVGAAAPLAAAPIVWRLSVPPTDAPRILRELRPERYLVDWAGGLVWIGLRSCDPERIRAVVREGHATLIKAPPQVRAVTRVFPPLPPALAAVAARLKSAFDPVGRLNPGRMS